MHDHFSRRGILKGLAILTVAGSAAARAATATAKLDVKDPKAVALGYVDNAKDVDARKFPSYAKGSTCENCMQLQGKAPDSYRPCSLFPDKLVSIQGWCSGWTAEM